MNRITGSEGLFGKVNTKLLRVAGADIPAYKGKSFYVDSVSGKNTNNGKSWDKPFLTLAYALTKMEDRCTLWVSGRFQEQVIVPQGLDYFSMIAGSRMRRSAHIEGMDTAPLVHVKAKNFYMEGFYLEPNNDAAAVKLTRAAVVANGEANDATLVNLEIWTGKYGIDLDGAPNDVAIIGGSIRNLRASGGTAIFVSSAAQVFAKHTYIYKVRMQGNVNHIVGAFSDSIIEGCVLADAGNGATTTSKIDLNGGTDNQVVGNFLAGIYSIAGGYRAGTNDDWVGNFLAGGVSTGNPA